MTTQKREHEKMFVGRSNDKIKPFVTIAVKTKQSDAIFPNEVKHENKFKRKLIFFRTFHFEKYLL